MENIPQTNQKLSPEIILGINQIFNHTPPFIKKIIISLIGALGLFNSIIMSPIFSTYLPTKVIIIVNAATLFVVLFCNCFGMKNPFVSLPNSDIAVNTTTITETKIGEPTKNEIAISTPTTSNTNEESYLPNHNENYQ